MTEKKKKETRVMRVTMDVDEFDKYDRGETHSDSGLRNEAGRLSALPDIAPIEESDLPEREVVVYQDRYLEPEEPSIGQKIAVGAINIAADILQDPEIQESLRMLASAFWRYKVKPEIKRTISKMKGESTSQTEAEKLIVKRRVAYQNAVSQFNAMHVNVADFDNESTVSFIVNEEQAQMILNETRKKAKELSAMIYLLSNLCIKDEKSNEERFIEQTYIKQLVSEEASTTMRLLIENKQLNLIDEETLISFDDFLNGHVRNGEKLIPIPIQTEIEG